MKYQWSEIFSSIEGEGPFSGWPTTYIRFAKCNFTCRGFNNPEMVEVSNEVLGYDPKDHKSLDSLPPVEKGCDSIYAWDDRFKHMWGTGDEADLAKATLEKVPHQQWKHPVTGLGTVLSLTGGEPTLRAKQIPLLLEQPEFDDLRLIIMETNCSVPLTDQFITELNIWQGEHPDRLLAWSNSPKLSASGEPHDKAIRPDIAMKQRSVTNSFQYFKFVCDDSVEMFEEVAAVMEEYYEAGIPRDTQVMVMPMSCTADQQDNIAANVADMCIDRGYIYCHRIHNSVYSNAIGK